MRRIVILGFLVFSVTVSAGEIQFDLMHTRQDCKHLGYQPTFCHRDVDQTSAAELSGMTLKIGAQIDRAIQASDPKKASIYLAYLSFSNTTVQRKLCEAIAAGVNVRIVLDAASAGGIDQLLSHKVCQETPNRPKVSLLGGLTSSPWRLHHNKFLFVNPGPGKDINLNISSGNLSVFGTSLHMDHWLTMVAPSSSNLVRAQLCVMKALNETTEYADSIGGHNGDNDDRVAEKYIESREECYASGGVIPMNQPDTAIAKESVALMFSPNYDEVYSTLSKEINKVRTQGKNGYIYIAIQHFTHKGIGNDLVRASKAGVDVRIIMDDDVVTNKGEVQGAMKHLNELKAKAPRIQVRYLETNHLAGGNGAMMHNKFAILNGQRVLAGAGQYTYAAMQNNWENFALTQVPSLSKKYAEYFKELWELSVDEGYVREQLQYNEDHTNEHPQPAITFSAAERQFHYNFNQLLGK